jgi:Predicted phosphohydrolases
MKILHISDIHFRMAYKPSKEGYEGMLFKMQSPLIPMTYCLQEVQKEHGFDILVISGDLTEDGMAKDYAFLKKQLKKLLGDIPIVVTLGNHDRKAQFREGWLEDIPVDKCYNDIYDAKSFSIISFDSSTYGNPKGSITKEQLSWLWQALKDTQDKPVILLTHHHLLHAQSELPCLDGADELFELIKDSNISCILNGHTHHQYSEIVAGIPYFTAGSMSFYGEDEGNGMVRFEEKYGYQWYQIEDGQIIKQRAKIFSTGRQLKTITMN